MSQTWTHSICDDCWFTREPGREPVRVVSPDLGTCCFCGMATNSGIFVRESPDSALLVCGGDHG